MPTYTSLWNLYVCVDIKCILVHSLKIFFNEVFASLFQNVFHFPRGGFPPPTLCKVIFCPKASLLAVSVQPRAVLLHLPSDNEQHLCHVLRKLFSEKCAETEAKREKVRRTDSGDFNRAQCPNTKQTMS